MWAAPSAWAELQTNYFKLKVTGNLNEESLK